VSNVSETYNKLYTLFEERASAIVNKHGKTVMSWDDVYATIGPKLRKDSIVHAWRSPTIQANALAAGYRCVSSKGYYLTAGDGVDADVVQSWENFYDAAIPDNELYLGAEACEWGVDSDENNADSIIWPRLAVLADKL